MSRRTCTVIALLLPLSFVGVVTATAAQADTYRHRDATHDMWHTDAFGKVKIAKSDPIGDIKRLKVRLGQENLVLKVWYRRVYAKGTLTQIWWFKGATGVNGAQYSLADKAVTMTNKAGSYPACDGSSVVVDAKNDTTTARIPVACLKSPDQLKVAAQFKGYFYKANPEYLSYDLGLVKGLGGGKIRYSPWIAAG